MDGYPYKFSAMQSIKWISGLVMKMTCLTVIGGSRPVFNWYILTTSSSLRKLYSAMRPIGPVNCSSQMIA